MSVEAETIIPNTDNYEFPLKGRTTVNNTNHSAFFKEINNLNVQELIFLKEFYYKNKKQCFDLFKQSNYDPYDIHQSTDDKKDSGYHFEKDDGGIYHIIRKDIFRTCQGKLARSLEKKIGDILYTFQYIFFSINEANKIQDTDFSYVQGMNFLTYNFFRCCNFNEFETIILLFKYFFEFKLYWIYPGNLTEGFNEVSRKKNISIGFPIYQTLVENTNVFNVWEENEIGGKTYDLKKWKEFDDDTGEELIGYLFAKLDYFFKVLLLPDCLMKGSNQLQNEIHHMQKLWKILFKYGNKNDIDTGLKIFIYSLINKEILQLYFSNHELMPMEFIEYMSDKKMGILFNNISTDKQLKKNEKLFNKKNLDRIQKIYQENNIPKHDFAMLKFKQRKGNIFSKFKGGKKKKKYTQRSWVKIKKSKTFKKR
jgi:hypothetical protein